eukprot:CAMPEP_0115852504 /NCGR_PEP_ID=MMETSP0287-20121206/13032_1 /TAXON_ID=412157 /ORGANISM="Chrysochromulina rotalis, Strain UIO044" /LENGTH=223 /DNA_ID=CAMNT_0003306571 /DNA_START=25 /DNA_END=696 /DNA_ORIENTATION=+
MSRAMRVAVRPFGVLGTRMTLQNTIKKVAAVPAPGLPIVDPAGLHHIRNGPRGAGGAAGQIYDWLGISDNDAFPIPVRSAIQAPLQAKLQFYGMKACLHVVGPDFNQRRCSQEQALDELTQCYDAMLRQFARSRLGGLRMLPISGGIFAGPFAPELPALTCSALRTAFDALPNDLQHIVSVARLDMCIFMESEFKSYAEAFEEETLRAAQFADSLEMGSTPKL